MVKVLFDSQSWLKEDVSAHIKDYLECTDQTLDNFPSSTLENPSKELKEAVLNWLEEDSQLEWEYFLELCSKETDNHCLVTGYFMSWMGPQAGGKIYNDLETAVKDIVMDDSHVVFSIDDSNNLILDETHHDAPISGNHYEFMILTAEGEKYYTQHMYDERRTLHENLKLCGRSRSVNIKIFNL